MTNLEFWRLGMKMRTAREFGCEARTYDRSIIAGIVAGGTLNPRFAIATWFIVRVTGGRIV